jgi:hypothetical protein
MKTVWLSVLALCAVVSAQDTDPPYVDEVYPEDGDYDVPRNTDIVFHCKDDRAGVDVDTIDFTVRDTSLGTAITRGAGELSGVSPKPTYIIDGDLDIDDSDPNDVVCTFDPYDPLPPLGIITCTVAAGLADEVGNEMVEDFVWIFETAELWDVVDEASWGEVKAREW